MRSTSRCTWAAPTSSARSAWARWPSGWAPCPRTACCYQPTVIWTSPSYAWHLGEVAKEKGYDPRTDFNIHTIIVAGEAGGSIPSTRESIENLWGAKVVDFYGMSDIYGACAAACEAHDGLHIVEDQILVETVDPTTGEVIAEAGTQVSRELADTIQNAAVPYVMIQTEERDV